MTLERQIRAIAGVFILASLALAHWVDARFLWLTAFVGVNLLQSAFTHWCLMEDILRKLGTAPLLRRGGLARADVLAARPAETNIPDDLELG